MSCTSQFVLGLMLGAGSLAMIQGYVLWRLSLPPRAGLPKDLRRVCGRECSMGGDRIAR